MSAVEIFFASEVANGQERHDVALGCCVNFDLGPESIGEDLCMQLIFYGVIYSVNDRFMFLIWLEVMDVSVWSVATSRWLW